METRICRECGVEKPYNNAAKKDSKASGFMGAKCWACYLAANREARSTEEARAKHNAANRKLRSTTGGRAKAVAANVAAQRKRRKTDAWFRLRLRLAIETNRILKDLANGRGTDSACRKLFGADRQAVIAHFESMFRPGLGWHNYKTEWTADHWWPMAMAQSDVELRQLALLDNLNILTMEEHRLKTLEDLKLVRHSV